MTQIRIILLIAVAALVTCCSDTEDATTEADPITIDAEDLKSLIAEAAATNRRLMGDIATMGQVDPVYLIEEYGETLTCHMIILTIAQPKPGEGRFVELSTTAKPADLSEALHAPSGGSVCSILYPEYISGLDWENDGMKLEGRFDFEATNKAYKGGAAFVAVTESGRREDLYVSSFILDSEGLRLDRADKKAKWERSPITD